MENSLQHSPPAPTALLTRDDGEIANCDDGGDFAPDSIIRDLNVTAGGADDDEAFAISSRVYFCKPRNNTPVVIMFAIVDGVSLIRHYLTNWIYSSSPTIT